MSLLDYFALKRNRSLPNPRGPLSLRIPSIAIASAIDRVRSVLAGRSSIPGSRKGEKHQFYSPKIRAEIGELACNLGPSEAAKRYSKKLEHPVNESTVRRFRTLYLEERHSRRV